MADISKELPLTSAWIEVSAALILVDGTEYYFDLDHTDNNAIAYWAQTTTALPAPVVEGHPMLPFARGVGQITGRVFDKQPNKFLWLRMSFGPGVLKVTEV